MNTSNPFHLQASLNAVHNQHRPALAFTARTADEFKAWQAALREQARSLLGLSGRTLPTHPTTTLLQAVDRGTYMEEKYALQVGNAQTGGELAPMYLLIPKREAPFTPVLVFHGHNPSVQYVLGHYPDPATAADRLAAHNNYAQALAEAGYFVCAIEQRGFGERISDQLGDQQWGGSCRHLSFEYMMNGRTLMGERCWDGMVAINYLRTRTDVRQDRLGCTGNSGGGTTTMWLALLDERISVATPSCFFCTFRDSILGMWHCECNYVPNTLRFADMGDLMAAMAPRPLRIIAGELDPIYPVTPARQQFATVERAYALLGAANRCSLAVHPGGHAHDHALSQSWLNQWL
jgi:dienelactone hydrolase